jgi:hypothetical protein
MKTVTALAPLAIGVGIIIVLTWFLLDREIGPGKWLLAGLLFAHGWVHLMFVFPKPEPATADGPTWPFDMARSWLVTGVGLDVGLIRSVGVIVMAGVVIGFLLAALSTVGVIVPRAWWPGLVAGSALGSLVLLGLFFSPTLLLGAAIDVALLWFVLASAWRPLPALPTGAG